MTEPLKIVVAICTYRRNEPLRVLLRALRSVAETTAGRAKVGVVVVDDNNDQRARAVAEEFGDVFELGCLYRHSGRQNISHARNLAVNTASVDSDWVAMIDDDCEPEPTWLCAFLDVIEATGADCATGAMRLRVPPRSPAWLSDQPFFDDLHFSFEDHALLQIARKAGKWQEASIPLQRRSDRRCNRADWRDIGPEKTSSSRQRLIGAHPILATRPTPGSPRSRSSLRSHRDRNRQARTR